MGYEKVLKAKDIVIGTKQTLRALEEGNVSEVIVAEDAEKRVVSPVEELAKAKDVPISYVDSMKKLGKACGIDVGAATVALKK